MGSLSAAPGVKLGWNVGLAGGYSIFHDPAVGGLEPAGFAVAFHAECHPHPLFGVGLLATSSALPLRAGTNAFGFAQTNSSLSELGLRLTVGRVSGPWAGLEGSLAFITRVSGNNLSSDTALAAQKLPGFVAGLSGGWRIPFGGEWTFNLELRLAWALPGEPGTAAGTWLFWIRPGLGIAYCI